ncbi:MAG: valine dehydrogenase [Chloroflexi bacterium]|nr:valine dehydrogenase [Chloroflexota bacterium]MDA1146262.1 valine dehydrogenase [Chloroflexota bacterium]
MGLLELMEQSDHESVYFRRDPRSGLRAIVAVHSTVLGPALGGTRWYPYPNEDEALEDVLRLSSAMTAKAAVAGLAFGGGKAVVIGDPHAKTPAQIEAYARFVDDLGGSYVTTTDVGTTTAEMDQINEFTPHVVGVSPSLGGGGDTSELTALTITEGMRAALEVAFDSDTFQDRHIVVLGIGKVGARVARIVAERGARVTLADIRANDVAALAAELSAEVVDPAAAMTTECDVFSPNALGGLLNPNTIPLLRCRVVCGGANNQLASDPSDARFLAARNIVYAPDYVVNSGGLISAAVERDGYDAKRARTIAGRVHDTTLTLLQTAKRDGISTAEAAQHLVAARLAAARP